MKKVLLIVTIIMLSTLSFSQNENKPHDVYKVNSKIVTEDVFNAFKAELKEIEGTYSCKMMTSGAFNSYEAKDKKGQVYIVSNLFKEEAWFCVIEKKKMPKN